MGNHVIVLEDEEHQGHKGKAFTDSVGQRYFIVTDKEDDIHMWLCKKLWDGNFMTVRKLDPLEWRWTMCEKENPWKPKAKRKAGGE